MKLLLRLNIIINLYFVTGSVLILYANDKETKDVRLGVFIDLSKAFDSINNDILLHKLHFYGIRGISNMWFSST